MWKNIGHKIKALAKVIFWVEAVFSVICAIGMIIAGAVLTRQASGYSSYGNYYSSSASSVGIPGVVLILYGVFSLFAGPFMAWISSFAMYGFGQLVESSEETAGLTRQIIDQNNTLLRMNDATASAAVQLQRSLLPGGQPARQPFGQPARQPFTPPARQQPFSQPVQQQKPFSKPANPPVAQPADPPADPPAAQPAPEKDPEEKD